MPRMTLKKASYAGAGVAALVLLIMAFLPDPVGVDLAVVDRGILTVVVSGEGKTRVREIYTVSAPIAGRVERIDIEVGDEVKRGETILAILLPGEPSFLDVRAGAQAEARVKAAEAKKLLAEAEHARGEAELVFARADLARARRLRQTGAISQRALDRAELEMRVRQAQVETALSAIHVTESELESARAELLGPASNRPEEWAENCCIEVKAPVDGKVLRVLQKSENIVSAGHALVEIGDPAALEIVVDLLSADAVKVREGAAVRIEQWGGQEALSGRVQRVEPSGFTKISALGIEEQRVNVIVDLVSPAEVWQSLGHGFRVEAAIVIWQQVDVQRLSLSALFRVQDRWAVFVAEDGRARLRFVEIGRRNDRHAEVSGGVDEGDAVILHPGDLIDDGTRIFVR